MGKGILGVVAGLAVWMIVVSVAGLVLWYHMTFLLSLVPLTYAGGRIPPVSF